MAYEPEVILRLRHYIGDTDSAAYEYTDTQLTGYLDDAEGEPIAAAAVIWRVKAASYADLVDISEAGSSRKNSDLFKNAISMAEWFEGGAGGPAPPTGVWSTTRAITRP